MAVVQCGHGHYFDLGKFARCPHCEAGGGDGGRTAALGAYDEQKRMALARQQLTAYARKDVPETDRTVSVYTANGRRNPVVGWLVCVEGLEKGLDFRLHAGRNFIGRAPSMDICLPNDPQIHRENHCSIIYEPNRKQFMLLAGDGTIPLRNGEAVGASSPLSLLDRIEIGSLVFYFVPFCGEGFAW